MSSLILKFFAYEHLPPMLQERSKPLCDLARQMDESLPDSAEKSAGLRKLLEAKDAFVRAALPVLAIMLAFSLQSCTLLEGASATWGAGVTGGKPTTERLIVDSAKKGENGAFYRETKTTEMGIGAAPQESALSIEAKRSEDGWKPTVTPAPSYTPPPPNNP